MANLTFEDLLKELDLVSPEELLKRWRKDSGPSSTLARLADIEGNRYVQDKLTVKLVEHYMQDMGKKFLQTYKAQKDIGIAVMRDFQDKHAVSLDSPLDVTTNSAPCPEDCITPEDLAEAEELCKPQLKCYPGRNEWKKWEKAIENINTRRTILFSIDLEAYEMDTTRITEIGISIYDPRENFDHSVLPLIRTYHFCVSEHWHLRNGRYVADAKENYLFGKSEVLPMEQATSQIADLIDEYLIPHSPAGHTWRRALVGHGISNDLEWLNDMGIVFPSNVLTLDTQKLHSDLYQRQISLKRLLTLLQVPHTQLHNAANDSYFTLQALLSMCDIGTRLKLDLDDWYSVRRRDDDILADERRSNPPRKPKGKRPNRPRK